MTWISPLRYLAILCVVASHYSLGRRLRIEPPITACLAGLALTALGVAALANVCAVLIRPFILISVCFWGVWTFLDLRESNPFGSRGKFYLFALLAASLLFLVYNPGRVFFKWQDGHWLLQYNRHYAYLCVPATEMLKALNWTRLKIGDLYPIAWTRYHFFSGATIAVLEGLFISPDLCGYFAAKTVLMILIFLSLIEYLSGAFNVIANMGITDVLNGYKGFRRDVFTRFPYKSGEFEIEIELVANALKAGYRIGEFACHEKARAGGEAKSRVVRHGTRFLLKILQLTIPYRLSSAYRHRPR